jgi:hypothetical protein
VTPAADDRSESPEQSAPHGGADRPDGGDSNPPRLSGDAALAAAIERSLSPQGTTALNIGDTTPLPLVADTANVRLGPPLDDANLALLPLVGVWRGEGHLHSAGDSPDRLFGQQLTISHDGRGFLRHESVSWLTDDDGTTLPAAREVGWWRPQPDGVVELVLADADGVVEVYYGAARTLASWSMGTDAVLRTTSAPAVTGATRLYGIVDGKLAYVYERATTERPLRPYASALLSRVAG